MPISLRAAADAVLGAGPQQGTASLRALRRESRPRGGCRGLCPAACRTLSRASRAFHLLVWAPSVTASSQRLLEVAYGLLAGAFDEVQSASAR